MVNLDSDDEVDQKPVVISEGVATDGPIDRRECSSVPSKLLSDTSVQWPSTKASFSLASQLNELHGGESVNLPLPSSPADLLHEEEDNIEDVDSADSLSGCSSNKQRLDLPDFITEQSLNNSSSTSYTSAAFMNLVGKNSGNNKPNMPSSPLFSSLFKQNKSNSKMFVCDLCNRTFSNASNLTRHKHIIHDGQKPFECEICRKRFSLKQNLQSHQRIHFRKENELQRMFNSNDSGGCVS